MVKCLLFKKFGKTDHFGAIVYGEFLSRKIRTKKKLTKIIMTLKYKKEMEKI